MPLSSVAFAFGLLLFVPAGWAVAAEKHSGAVVSADEKQITIEEMGPWRGPSTRPSRRTFQWNDSTRILLAERTWDGEGGWRWAFNDEAAPPSGLRAGDYVTVRDLIDEVGRDAVRFFLLLRKADSPEHAIVAFVDSTYEQAANLARWNRACQKPVSPRS
jgi:hypothetical protein